MAAWPSTPPEQLIRLVRGFWTSRAIYVAAGWYPWTWWIILPGASSGHLAGSAGPRSGAGTP
jgi:hypothetical protein